MEGEKRKRGAQIHRCKLNTFLKRVFYKGVESFETLRL